MRPGPLEAVNTAPEDFEKREFLESCVESFTEWTSSLRPAVWLPFETRLLEWLKHKVAAAEADEIVHEDWKPTFVELVSCLHDAQQPDAVAASYDLVER